jgi:hypothetical protein
MTRLRQVSDNDVQDNYRVLTHKSQEYLCSEVEAEDIMLGERNYFSYADKIIGSRGTSVTVRRTTDQQLLQEMTEKFIKWESRPPTHKV